VTGKAPLTVLLALLLCAIADIGRAQPVNLARDCSYTMTPRPNYSLTTDADDDRQLTDGAYTVWNPIWLRTSTVGWANASPVTIVVDLRSVQAISGISYSTGAGKAGVAWPRSVFVLVSDDGQRFFPVADLADIPSGAPAPPATGYAAFRYTTTNLDTHGRYVALIVDPNGPYVFTDEIEVLAGDPGRIGSPLAGESTTDLHDFFVQAHIRVSMTRRLTVDLQDARAALASSATAQAAADLLSRELDAIQAGIAAMATPNPATFMTVLPLNDLHARIFAVRGAIAGANGLAPLTAWAANPWDFVHPVDKPPASSPHDSVSIVAMNGETRAGAISVASSVDRPLNVSVNIAGLSVDENAPDLKLFEVVWTDTGALIPVADALLPLDRSGPTLALPAGMTRQIWISFAPAARAAGAYRGYVELAADGIEPARVPIELKVLPGTFSKRPALHLGGWDYTDTTNLQGLTPTNTVPLIEQLRALGVDSPWATTSVMPPGVFDATGRLAGPPPTQAFDTWIANWPDASGYFVFVNAHDTFGNVSSVDTSRFSTAIGEWITYWVQHAATAGIRPSQLLLLLVDEPHSAAQDSRIVTWARAVKAAQPAVRIWEDPTYTDPAASQPQLLGVADVLAIKTWLLTQQGPAFADFYRQRGQQGQELALYGASGPARLMDPYSYERLQAWMCADLGASSSFFWSFSDDAGGHSWNEYATTQPLYSPLFLGGDQVTTTKHAEAIREGVEDFEYIAMLRRRVQALAAGDPDRPDLVQASAFVDNAAAAVLHSTGTADLQWTSDKDRSAAERVRLAIASTLQALDGGDGASIGRAAPSIMLVGGTVRYDGQPHPATAAATGAYGAPVPGSFVLWYTPGGSVPPLYGGVYSVKAQFTSADPGYADALANTTITVVEPTAISIAASPRNAVFGTPLTFVASVAGAASTPTGPVRFAIDGEPIGDSLPLQDGRGSITIQLPATGRHTVTAEYGGSDAFTAASTAMDYDVAPVRPAVTWSEPAPIAFGTALDTRMLDATANVSGAFSYAPAAGTVLAAGSHQLDVTFVPEDRTDYTTAAATVNLIVMPATPLIGVKPVTVTYDGQPHPAAGNVSGIGGASIDGSLTIEYAPGGASPPVNAGAYSATLIFHSNDPNYGDATAATTITIDAAPLVAMMTYPADGAVDADLSIPVQWTSVLNAQAYYLYVGSTPGAKDLVNSGETAGPSYQVRNLPAHTVVYARLWTRVAGVWRYSDSRFSALPLEATMVYPVNGARDVDLPVPLQWTAIPGADAYYLYIGTTPGAKDLVNTGEISTTSRTVTNLPSGLTVYVRLWTRLGGIWRFTDSTFTRR